LSETTAVDATATAAADAESTINARDDEPDEPKKQVIRTDHLPSGSRSVVAVTTLTAVAAALIAVSVGRAVESSPLADQYVIGELPVEPAPAPPSAPVQLATGKPTPPGANQRLVASFASDGMWQQSGPYDEEQARDLCQDLANGRSLTPYIEGTEEKNPQLTPQEAAQVVYEAIESYCPQYAHRSRGKR
jgi:Protein of unknown function (DUF732)